MSLGGINGKPIHTMRTHFLPRILFFLLLLAGGLTVSAQNYSSAAGLRLGYPWAASYKTFISEASAIEAYVGYRGWTGYNWFSVNGAYLKHSDIDEVDGLQWYAGGGVGAQFWSYDFAESSSTTFSVAGYLGLEYTFEDAPVSVSIDWVPTFFLGDTFGGIGFNRFGAGYGGLAARYVLGR